jgi:hypothetical protein
MTTIIYSLSDPINKQIKYVGKTCVNINARYAQHIYQWKRSKKLTHVNAWIKNLYLKNQKPIIEILDEVIEDWAYWESYWIQQCKTWGYDLCNHTLGGEGTKGYKASQESILKRLTSLKTSKAWKEKHNRHSLIMKNKHAEGLINLGYGHLSKEKRINIGLNHSKKLKNNFLINPKHVHIMNEKRRVKVHSIDDENNITYFNSVTDAANYYKIAATNITKVCKNKAKKAKNLIFRYT